METLIKAVLALLLQSLVFGKECVDMGPLGMISGEIKDWQITASSTYPNEWDSGCAVQNARPYLRNKLGWCARMKSTSEWLMVDLGVVTSVTAVLVQGRGDGQEWVTSFSVSYSKDGERWNYVTDGSGITRIFNGNKDAYGIEHVYLPDTIEARFVKVQVQSWHKHPSMRVEFIGCKDNRQLLAQPPYGELQASSSHSFKKGSSCQPSDGHILSSKSWCAADNDGNQWLQIDVGPPTLVTALVTKGRGDTGRKQWVTRYKVSFSNDTENWTFYKDSLILEQKYLVVLGDQPDRSGVLLPSRLDEDSVVEFGGNGDKNTERIHYLAKPFTARYVRFHPTEWHKDISMRAGLYGRKHSGECGAGFTRPNTASACVENIAFKKETWLNKERHSKRALVSGSRDDLNIKLAQKAVDGNLTNDINACTILDNYYDDEPQLTIDLGNRRDVSGVVLYMWEGRNDQTNSYKDYALNLESLSVFITSGKTGEVLCGRIPNQNNQLLMKREQKLFCNQKIEGRYIRIQPEGRSGWYTKWYSAVICEVTAFT